MDAHQQDPAAQADNWRLLVSWVGTLLAGITPHNWGELSAMLASLLTLIIIGERIWKRYARWRAGKAIVPLDETDRGDL